MARSALHRNRLKRGFGFAVGVALFYAPFALLVRGVGLLAPGTTPATSASDVHTACLRMPVAWLAQPWMWPSYGNNPLSWLPLVVLPLAAVAAAPLFCGWLCPAGLLPEQLGRIVPERFKFDFRGRVDILPLRYGFFFGLILAPFVSASVCCSFCNFTHMQNLVSAATGDLAGVTYLTSLGLIAAAVWIVPLGLLTKGGRGWCLFLCPAGTLMGFTSAMTARFAWTRRIRTDASKCTRCGGCEDVCPMRAVGLESTPAAAVNHHLCNACLDCTKACPAQAISYRGGR